MPRTKRQKGRQPDPSSKSGKIRELLKTGMSPMEIAKKVGCTPALVYNVKGRAGGRKKAGRKPGRPRASNAAEVNGLASVLQAMQGAGLEQAKLRAVLEKIQSVIADVIN